MPGDFRIEDKRRRLNRFPDLVGPRHLGRESQLERAVGFKLTRRKQQLYRRVCGWRSCRQQKRQKDRKPTNELYAQGGAD
jgi:hypothetical protein